MVGGAMSGRGDSLGIGPSESDPSFLNANLNDIARVFCHSWLVFEPNVQVWDKEVVKDAKPNAIVGAYWWNIPSKGWVKVFDENQEVPLRKWDGAGRIGLEVGMLRASWGEDNHMWTDWMWMSSQPYQSAAFAADGRVDSCALNVNSISAAALRNVAGSYLHIKEMNVMVDGVPYMIPNIWWSPGFSGLMTDTHEWFTTTMFLWQNYAGYDQVNLYVKDAKTWVYGYRHGDKNQPVLFEVNVASPQTVAGWENPTAVLGLKAVADITVDGTNDFPEEFNWRLARARFELGWKNVPVAWWVKDDRYHHIPSEQLYLFMKPYDQKLESCSLTVLNTNLLESSKEYVNQVVMRNDTDAVMQFKTSDYKHTITDTTTMVYEVTSAQKFNFSLKETMKAKENILVLDAEMSVEVTEALALEFSEKLSKTQTHTETKEFTVPGQSVNVPPKSAMRLVIEWWRAVITGTTKTVFPLVGQIHTQVNTVRPGNRGPAEIVDMDIAEASKWLQMKSVFDEAKIKDKPVKGAFVGAEMSFTAEVGVMASYSLTEMPYVAPKEVA